VHGERGTGSHLDGNLRVIDAREVAGTSGLMLFGLEREGVRVHTWVGAASVVVEGLHLVEVLTLLFLESVLTVEDELEGAEGPTASSVKDLLPPTPSPRASMGAPKMEGETTQLEFNDSTLDTILMSAAVDAVVKFHKVDAVVAALEKHHTSSLTGWLYERRTCLVLAESTVSVPVCWTCSIRYS